MRQAATADKSVFWNDVDPTVASSLNDAQKNAIVQAVVRRRSEHHSSDIRLSAFGYYLVLMMGKERRSNDRLVDERNKRPVFTAKNLPLLLLIWGSVIYTLVSVIPAAIKPVLQLFL